MLNCKTRQPIWDRTHVRHLPEPRGHNWDRKNPPRPHHAQGLSPSLARRGATEPGSVTDRCVPVTRPTTVMRAQCRYSVLFGHDHPVVAGFWATHAHGTMGDIILIERAGSSHAIRGTAHSLLRQQSYSPTASPSRDSSPNGRSARYASHQARPLHILARKCATGPIFIIRSQGREKPGDAVDGGGAACLSIKAVADTISVLHFSGTACQFQKSCIAAHNKNNPYTQPKNIGKLIARWAHHRRWWRKAQFGVNTGGSFCRSAIGSRVLWRR